MTLSRFLAILAIGTPVVLLAGSLIVFGGEGDGEAAAFMGLFAMALGLLAFLFFGALAFVFAHPSHPLLRLLRGVGLVVFGLICIGQAFTSFVLVRADGPAGEFFALILVLMMPVGLLALLHGVEELTALFFALRERLRPPPAE